MTLPLQTLYNKRSGYKINFITLPTAGKMKLKWLEMANGFVYENIYVEPDFRKKISLDSFISIFIQETAGTLTEITINTSFILSFE